MPGVLCLKQATTRSISKVSPNTRAMSRVQNPLGMYGMTKRWRSGGRQFWGGAGSGEQGTRDSKLAKWRLMAMDLMSVVMLSISCSTVDCNSTVLYLTKTFVVKMLYFCNLLCYVKCSTSLLTRQTASYQNISINLLDNHDGETGCSTKKTKVDMVT